jgi:hypothetical protein
LEEWDNSNCEAGIINFRNRKARESYFAPNRGAILQGLMMVYTNQRNILEGSIAVMECKDRTGLQGWSWWNLLSSLDTRRIRHISRELSSWSKAMAG